MSELQVLPVGVKEKIMKYGTWYGKNLEEYTKEELLEIIVELGKMKKRNEEEFSRDLSFFSDLALKRRI